MTRCCVSFLKKLVVLFSTTNFWASDCSTFFYHHPLLQQIVQTFLSYLISQELKQITHPNELQDYCYVFPTRRACKFFEEQLRKQFKGTYFWSPRTFSIIDFFTYLYEETFDSVVMEGTRL